MSLFAFLRGLSFANSAVFTGLLIVWLVPGLEAETSVLGWAHGIMWIVLSLLSIVAVRRRELPFWLAVVVAVVGGVGPFAGTAGFIIETRRRQGPPADAQPAGA
jgi:hypothetical protein